MTAHADSLALLVVLGLRRAETDRETRQGYVASHPLVVSSRGLGNLTMPKLTVDEARKGGVRAAELGWIALGQTGGRYRNYRLTVEGRENPLPGLEVTP